MWKFEFYLLIGKKISPFGRRVIYKFGKKWEKKEKKIKFETIYCLVPALDVGTEASQSIRFLPKS